MLRRNPTTIRLTAEDLRDSALADHAVLAAALHSETQTADGEADDQNWDSSVDESYLGSRGAGAGAGTVGATTTATAAAVPSVTNSPSK